jgi:hypothetical protein
MMSCQWPVCDAHATRSSNDAPVIFLMSVRMWRVEIAERVSMKLGTRFSLKFVVTSNFG